MKRWLQGPADYLGEISLIFIGPVVESVETDEAERERLRDHIAAEWDARDRDVMVDLGRAELSLQLGRIDEVRGRAQVLLTTGLALGAVLVASFASYAESGVTWVALWWVSMSLLVLGIAGAVAVMVSPAPVEYLSTSAAAEFGSPVTQEIAVASALMVRLGSETVNRKLGVFRGAVLLIVLAAGFAAAGRIGGTI